MLLPFVCHIEIVLFVSVTLLVAVGPGHAHRRDDFRNFGEADKNIAKAPTQLSRPPIFSEDDLFSKYFFSPSYLGPVSRRKQLESLQTFTEDALSQETDASPLARHPRDRWRVALVKRKYNDRINERAARPNPSDAGITVFGGADDIQAANDPFDHLLTQIKANELKKKELVSANISEPTELYKVSNILPKYLPSTLLSHRLSHPFRPTTPRHLTVDILPQHANMFGQQDRYYWNTEEINTWDVELYYKNQQALTEFNVLNEVVEESQSLISTTLALPVPHSSTLFLPPPKHHKQQPSLPIAPHMQFYPISPKYFITMGPPVYMPLSKTTSRSKPSKMTPSTKKCYWRNKVSNSPIVQGTILGSGFKIIGAIVENKREPHIEDNINFHRQVTTINDTRNESLKSLLHRKFTTHFHQKSHTKGKLSIRNHNRYSKYTITPMKTKPGLNTESEPSRLITSATESEMFVGGDASDLRESTVTHPTKIMKQQSKQLLPPPAHQDDRVRFFELYDQQDEDNPEGEAPFPGRPTTSARTTTTAEKLFPQPHTKAGDHLTKDYIPEKSKVTIFLENYATENALLTTQSTHSEWAHWKDYPYIAMYIFEPANVHCDAFGISEHWLVTSAACLERHWAAAGAAEEEERAYVAYCGARWHRAERLNYVKFAAVHPRYHTHDQPRRDAYNIGAVKVGSSMGACAGWRPAVLLSHQFSPAPYGIIGVAVGWGLNHLTALDREQGRRPAAQPLISFTGPIYPGSCLDAENDTRADALPSEPAAELRYCMHLPPAPMGHVSTTPGEEVTRQRRGRGGRSGPGTPPGGGGVLLVGGKVVALWLEERRLFSGARARLFSGVWRGAGWLRQTALEAPDDHSRDLRLEI